MKHIKKVLFPFIFILPFILGIIGFLIEGEGLLDAAYYSFALYAVNPLYEDKNILIEITRWLAPAVVASGLLVFVKEISQRIKDFFVCVKKDSFALYGDDNDISVLKNCLPNTVISKDNSIKDSANHIILFKDDTESFKFFNENQKDFNGKNIYIKSDNIEMFKNDSDKFKILNFNEIIARNYWVEHHLINYFANGRKEIQIAIVGFDGIAQRILDYAILNNIYSLDQNITYHIWGDSELYACVHSDLSLMNNDKIIYHSDDWQSNIELISKTDRIIFTLTPDTGSLMMLADKCADSEIHCYNLDKNILDIIGNPRIQSFGQSSEVFTKENILLTDIYHSAKCLNFEYACLYGQAKASDGDAKIEAEWKELDAFTKNSNICAANYHLIRKIITENITLTASELAEMEHIRWCRFHFLHHWKEGTTENGKKDSINKIHPCLVPFDELSEPNKQKDFEAIEVLNKVFAKY
ncbi:MAG: hypothetical protein IKL10_00985 [Clostridia bacterium]|nr:hypothetical protein [Clostridia bacterium]